MQLNLLAYVLPLLIYNSVHKSITSSLNNKNLSNDEIINQSTHKNNKRTIELCNTNFKNTTCLVAIQIEINVFIYANK